MMVYLVIGFVVALAASVVGLWGVMIYTFIQWSRGK